MTDELKARCHSIKCWPEVFEEMLAGRKNAEFRLNDRDYQTGETLLIREWCPESKAYTHRELERKITHVLKDSFGVPRGYAMLSLAAAEQSILSESVNGEAVELVSQALQDHMEQHHGVVLKASEWDAAARAALPKQPVNLDGEAVERVREALERYGKHDKNVSGIPGGGCQGVWPFDRHPCTCGLSNALARIESVKGGETVREAAAYLLQCLEGRDQPSYIEKAIAELAAALTTTGVNNG